MQRFFCKDGACLPEEVETDGATCIGQCGEGICQEGSCHEGSPPTVELLFHYEPNPGSPIRNWSGIQPYLVLDPEGRAFWLEEENKQHFILVGATTDGVFLRRAVDGAARSGWPPQLLVSSGMVVVSTDGGAQAFRSTDGSPVWRYHPLPPGTFERCNPPQGGHNPRGASLAATSDGRIVLAAWCVVPDSLDYWMPDHGIAVLRTETGEVLLASKGKGILRALLVDASDRILVAAPVDTPPGWGESLLSLPATKQIWKEATAEGKVTTSMCEIIDLASGAFIEMQRPRIYCYPPPTLMSGQALLLDKNKGNVFAFSLHTGDLTWSVALEPVDAEGPSSWGILLTSDESALVSHGHRPCGSSKLACFKGTLSEIDLAGALLRSCAIPNNLEFRPYAVRNSVVWGLGKRFSLDWRVVALRLPGPDESRRGWVTPWGGGSGEYRER